MANVATLTARYVADTTQFTAASARARGELAATEAGAKKTGGAFGGPLKVGLLGAGIAVAAGIGAFANYQRTLNTFQAVTNATGKEMATARKEAVKLGNDIALPGVSAGDAAQAMTELGRAGFSAKQSMQAVRGTLLLATVAQMDNADAAKITAQAINTFNLRASDSKRIVDLFAGAANASQAEVGDIADAFRYSAAQAKTAGVGIQDLTVAIATMSDQGVEASVAGTSLRAMFTKLEPETLKSRLAFSSLNLITKEGHNRFFDMHGQFIGLSKAIPILRKGLSGMTQQQRLTNLHQAFGVAGMRAWNTLLGTGKHSFDAHTRAVLAHADAEKVAARQTQGLFGVIEQLKNLWETSTIVLGEQLAPVVQAIVGLFLRLASPILTSSRVMKVLVLIMTALGGAFVAWRAAMLAAAAVQTIVAVGSQVLRTAYLVLTGQVNLLRLAQWQLNAAMAANPVGVIIIALIALGVALVIAYKKSETFRKIVQGALHGVTAAAKAVAEFFSETIPAAFDKVIKWIKSNWTKAVLFVPIVGPLIAAAAEIYKHWNAITGAISGALDSAIRWIKGNWTKAAIFIPIVGPVIAAIGEIVKHWDDIKAGLKKALGGIGAAAWDRIKAIGSVITEKAGAIEGWGSGIATKIKTNIVNTLKGIGGAAWNIINNIGAVITEHVAGIANWGSGIGSKIKNNVVSALTGIGGLAWGVIDNIRAVIAEHAAAIKGWGEGIVTKIKNGITGEAAAIKKAVQNLFGKVIDWVKSVLGIKSPSSVFHGIGVNVVKGFASGVGSAAGILRKAVTGMVSGLVGRATGAVGDAAQGVWRAIAGGSHLTSNDKVMLRNTTPQVQAAVELAREHGWHGVITSGFRTYAEQAALYQRYLAGGNLAAKPGTSSHESGEAIDVSDYGTFGSIMSRAVGAARLYNRLGARDPVHYSVSGFASGGIITKDMLARIGEGGRKEAVIPLESARGRSLLSRAASGGGGGSPTFVFNGPVGSKEQLMSWVREAMLDHKRHTGSLGLA